MKAVLINNCGKVHQFESVDLYEAVRGSTFRIVVEEVEQGAEWFTNNDPLLSVDVDPSGPNAITGVTVKSNADGKTKLQLRGVNDNLIKQWVIEVFSGEAARFSAGAQTTEPKD